MTADTNRRMLRVLARLEPDAVRSFVDSLSPAEVASLVDVLDGWRPATTRSWTPMDHQVPPEGDWWVWLLLGGRGAGKTDGGARWLDQQARARPGSRWAIVAPTKGDARRTCVEGDSGLLAHNPTIVFNRSKYEVTWPNGSVAYLYGAYTPEDRQRLRGPQFHGAWLEEFAAMRQLDERPNAEDPDVFGQMEIACRLGETPRIAITTTPKRRKRLVELVGRVGTDVVQTHGRMVDNPHLSDAYRERLLARYAGSALGAQELDGLLIDAVEGALLDYPTLDAMLVKGDVPDLGRRIVAVDPAVTSKATSDETGIIVAGSRVSDGRPEGYVLADLSGQHPVVGDRDTWAHVAVAAYHAYECSEVVAEVNQGGDLVAQAIHVIDPTVPVKMVRASVGKRARAEPVAQVARQGRWHHAGSYPELREQWATWDPADDVSPDRLDAEVWAAWHLVLGDKGGNVRSVAQRRKAEAPRQGGLASRRR